MKTVKLSDVVKRANTKEDRFNTSLLYYVGGEHIETDNVVIKDRGLIKGSTIGPMFYFGFKKGDVLLVSRNPHLRKAGMVSFDGICSEKTFVLETNDENVLLQDYLPFIFQTDTFWEYAEAHKSGSVNFFLNWSTLANYEFNLPPLEEQKKLAEVLWQIVATMESYKKLLAKTDEMVKAKFVEMFGDPVLNPYKIQTKKMKDVAPVESYNGVVDLIEDKVWLLNLDMIESNTGKIIERNCVFEKDLGNSVWKFNTENVLYSKLRPYLNKVIVPDMSGYATTELLPLKPNTNIITKKFLDVLLRHDSFVSYINSKTVGTKMPRVSMDIFRNFDVIIPSLESQQQFTDFVQNSEESKAAIQASLDSIKQVYKKIIAENLGGK